MNAHSEFDLSGVMGILRQKRPLFHSEADFQFALAWEVQTQYPDAAIRLEYCPQALPDMHIDILVDLNHKVYPIELKYKTLKLETLVDGEFYALKSHGAQDIGKYECLLDIQRVEAYSQRIKNFDCGYTIWLTNDPSYWKAPRRAGTMAEEFTIHNGACKQGTMAWAPHTGFGTLKGRESPIVLQSSYTVEWIDYSSISSERSGTLRYALLQIK